jgi:hypothetical protein
MFAPVGSGLSPDIMHDNHDIWAFDTAYRLYRRARRRARLGRVWRLLTGRRAGLPGLHDEMAPVRDRHALGLRTIPVRQVYGSEGRSADFDSAFRPLQERTRHRWIAIAVALLNGATLPPVDLIQVGERYYVRDGHHRVSAARALGQAEIDASVVAWAPAGAPGVPKETGAPGAAGCAC